MAEFTAPANRSSRDPAALQTTTDLLQTQATDIDQRVGGSSDQGENIKEELKPAVECCCGPALLLLKPSKLPVNHLPQSYNTLAL